MRSIKMMGMTIVAVLAFAAVGVASASAAEFQASAEGLALKGEATSAEQVFKTGSGTVECATATPSGATEALKATEQKVKVEYGSCKAFGASSVTVSPAEYDFNANGTVKIENDIVISVKSILGSCTVTVGPQDVGSVSYNNVGKGIEEESNVTGIEYTSSGGVCGSSGTEGTYAGSAFVEAEGGTIEVV